VTVRPSIQPSSASRFTGGAIYGLKGHKLYELKGANIYKLSGELMGHLNASHGSEMRLDRSTDRLFLEK
jgi:hypothetical protein